ncbi:MAG: ComF family protein [Verrucomicrobia bacterium]|nr:ComF family protein [Kiritimatiellia bacterium]MCO6399777.1 ComF family protein [Verrucomicrobiota bacterium]
MRQTGFVSVSAFFDLIFPRRCGVCGVEPDAADSFLCWNCRSQLRVVGDPHCSWCGNPLEGRVDHAYTCYHCTQMGPSFDRARSAMRFEGAVPTLIHQFKYRGALWLRKELVSWLVACVNVHYAAEAVDAVCSVPLYPARARERGYNQAAILAAALARHLHKPFWSRDLTRVRPTETQTHLTARQRLSNVAGAFRTRSSDRLRGRSILLVDDVMTTGATTSACAQALKEAGCRVVNVVTLARGQ